jgi:transcription initiation factor TFIID subunit 13
VLIYYYDNQEESCAGGLPASFHRCLSCSGLAACPVVKVCILLAFQFQSVQRTCLGTCHVLQKGLLSFSLFSLHLSLTSIYVNDTATNPSLGIVRQLLYAHGDDRVPLQETIRVLDDAVTDFIIESCHGAALIASHSGRQKVKVDDFRMLFRKDALKLGRMLELETVTKEQQQQRKLFDVNNDRVEKGMAIAEALGDLDSDDDISHAGTGTGEGPAKKRKRKGDDGDGVKGKRKGKAG